MALPLGLRGIKYHVRAAIVRRHRLLNSDAWIPGGGGGVVGGEEVGVMTNVLRCFLGSLRSTRILRAMTVAPSRGMDEEDPDGWKKGSFLHKLMRRVFEWVYEGATYRSRRSSLAALSFSPTAHLLKPSQMSAG